MNRQKITSGLTKHVGNIANACGASAILVYADALEDDLLELPPSLEDRVIYVSKTSDEQIESEERGGKFIRVPNVKLSRFGQAKIAIFLGLARGLINRGDVIVCLTGVPSSRSLDTIFVTEVSAEFEMSTSGHSDDLPEGVSAEVVERIIDIASELGSEGREGKPVGAMFVVGDVDKVLSLARQLIINPFRGYEEHERNILDPNLEETVKELSSLDGAFVVRGNGVIESCGVFVKTSLVDEEDNSLPRGLGARHHAAAGITAVTDSIAVTVSESTGTVTIFRDGKIVTELEKLRSSGNPD